MPSLLCSVACLKSQIHTGLCRTLGDVYSRHLHCIFGRDGRRRESSNLISSARNYRPGKQVVVSSLGVVFVVAVVVVFSVCCGTCALLLCALFHYRQDNVVHAILLQDSISFNGLPIKRVTSFLPTESSMLS